MKSRHYMVHIGIWHIWRIFMFASRPFAFVTDLTIYVVTSCIFIWFYVHWNIDENLPKLSRCKKSSVNEFINCYNLMHVNCNCSRCCFWFGAVNIIWEYCCIAKSSHNPTIECLTLPHVILRYDAIGPSRESILERHRHSGFKYTAVYTEPSTDICSAVFNYHRYQLLDTDFHRSYRSVVDPLHLYSGNDSVQFLAP